MPALMMANINIIRVAPFDGYTPEWDTAEWCRMQLFVCAKGVCLTITSNKGRTRLQHSDSAELLVLTKLPVVQPEKFITSPSFYTP